MNLGDLATFICKKVRQRDTQAVLDCKDFLNRRYELIYNESLWRDSLWTLDFTFTPEVVGVPESWAGIKFLPGVVDRLVALRMTDQPLDVVAAEHLYRSGIDEFERSGTPARYSTGAPVVAILPPEYDTNDVSILSGDASDDGHAWTMTIIDTNGDRVDYESELGESDSNPVALDIQVVERCTCVANSVAATLKTRSATETIATLRAGETSFPMRLPVRLVPKPSVATTFKALVKKKALPLTDDLHVPELRDIDNVLIPLVQGDMLERSRQYGKAQLKFQEGLALLESFKVLHVHQETQQEQFVPEVEQVSGISHWDFSAKGYWGNWS